MLRALLKLILILVLVVGVGAFLLGWWTGARHEPTSGARGTTGQVDTTRAREVGAEIGERAGLAAAEVKKAADDGSITAKIKSKMALDDSVKALDIHVDTTGGVVTLTGVVRSEAERTRAVQLARETNGVTTVRDRLQTR
jgi:hyperosmotically inducible protein